MSPFGSRTESGHATRSLVLVGAVGVEPTTNGLKGRCSATELRPYGGSEHSIRKRVEMGRSRHFLAGFGMLAPKACGVTRCIHRGAGYSILPMRDFQSSQARAPGII